MFVMWPFFLPLLVSGLRSIATIPAYFARNIFNKPGLIRMGILTNPNFYAASFLIIQGIFNTVAVTYNLYLYPPKL
jgi:hypothetical protein